MTSLEGLSIERSSLKPILASVVGRLVTAIGAVLTANGILAPEVVEQLISPVTSIVVGGLLSLGGVLAGAFSSRRKHKKALVLAMARPKDVNIV